MASIISELRSVTFQSNSTTVFVSELNIRKDNRMAPQQPDTLPKSSDFEVEQSQKSSPASNIGTSIESSPGENAAENVNQHKEEAKVEEPSSDDSGSVQNYQITEEFQSPLMRLQSALKKDGRLGKKLCLSNSSQKGIAENNWLPATAAGNFERNLSNTSSGLLERNLSAMTSKANGRHSPSTSTEVYHNELCSTTAVYHNGLPSNTTRIYEQQASTGVYDSNLSSSSAGIYNSGVPPMASGIFHGGLQSTPKGMYRNSLPSTSNSIYDASTFSCRVCDFTSVLKEEYEMHMNLHYNHKCPHCNYTSRTEGRLKRHVKEFHSDTPPESWAGSRASRKEVSSDQSLDNSVTSSNGKARTFRCKHCDFVAYQKAEFWKHSKIHIKPDKLLECPHCDFVTEFKHHHEYHLANHFGRKPFQCSMCNYKCVNKSMLNSHLKSHSNVYQFHCADCKYETKYCHSIKQHLKKQNHKPGIVLNQDGTPCPFQVIDVYGRRRGPRAKKRKNSVNIESNCSTSPVSSSNHASSVLSNSPQSMTFSTTVPMLQPNIPTLYQPYFSDYPQSLMMRTNPQMNNSNFSMPLTIAGRNHNSCFRCTICPFVTDDQDILKRHTLLHIASENQDLAKLYGINSEFFREQELALNGDMVKQKNCPEPEECEKKSFSPTAETSYNSHGSVQDYKQEHDDIVLETQIVKSEDGSSPKYRRISSPKNDDENDSFRGEFSSPSPPGSSSYSPDIVAYVKKVLVEHNRTSPNFTLKENRSEENESPIDLSGRKSSDSTKTDKVSEDIMEMQTIEQKIPPSVSCMESSNVSSTSQRNRRKGKAYRINHYMQYDEQSANQEFSKDDSSHNSIDSCENGGEDKDSSKGQSENSLRAQAIFPDKRQNVSFPTSHTESNGYSNLRQEGRNLSDLRTDTQATSNGINDHCPTSNLDRICERTEESRTGHSLLQNTVKSQNMVTKQSQLLNNSSQPDIYECTHCEIVFKNCTMHSLHMGYHGFKDPFTCNFCGHVTKNAVDFFIHIARASHA